MRCTCGYDFAKATLDALQRGSIQHESYAAVRDSDYPALMKIEAKVLAEKDREARRTLVLRAAQFVGVVMVCSLCERLLFVKPRNGQLVRYTREKE